MCDRFDHTRRENQHHLSMYHPIQCWSVNKLDKYRPDLSPGRFNNTFSQDKNNSSRPITQISKKNQSETQQNNYS